MTGNDIRKLAICLYNMNVETFAKDVYKKPSVDFYVEEKFDKMQKNPLQWMGELDLLHLQRLADIVSEA